MKLFVAFVILIGILSFQTIDDRLFKKPATWPEPIYNFSNNPLTQEKVNLGRVLFYDPILSRDNSISCASCHSPYNSFTHVDHDLSHGIEDRIGKRNSPVLVNLAWQSSFMWDGAVNHLDVQALAPIHNELEMDEDISHVVEKLNRKSLYKTLFYDAFGDSIATGEHALKSISQFMLTLISSNSKYDRVLDGKEEFNEQEERGYKLFKESCNSCHVEPLFTNNAFKSNGLNVDSTLNDLGRVVVSGLAKDSFLFKVPTLRNIEFSYPYMHDGRFKTLNQVLNHYDDAQGLASYASEELKNIRTLSSNEKVDIVAFLLTLSDRSFLFNQDFSYPREILLSQSKDER